MGVYDVRVCEGDVMVTVLCLYVVYCGIGVGFVVCEVMV